MSWKGDADSEIFKSPFFSFSSLSESELELELELDRDPDFDLKQKLADLDVTRIYLKHILDEILIFSTNIFKIYIWWFFYRFLILTWTKS